MPEQHAYLEPIRVAAAAVAADPPPLTAWEAGEDDGEVVDHGVERLLGELGWPTRVRSFTTHTTVLGSNPPRTVPHEHTERYFPASWLDALTGHVSKYTEARDAGQRPTVPDHLRLRNLPLSAGYDAVRAIIEAAWDYAWDELASSVAIMCHYDATSTDGLRYNLAVRLSYAPEPGIDLGIPLEGLIDDAEPPPPLPTTYEGRRRADEEDLFSTLRSLQSPKWRAWFLDTFNDRVAVHDTLARCGVEATEQLDVDLQRARYMLDADTSRMTIEELVIRLDARHRLLVSAFRAARDGAIKGDPHEESDGAGFGSGRTPNRPPTWNAMMELVGHLKGENTRWKDIRERVEQAHGYPFDSEEALRKHFERWQKRRKSAG